uniref:Uncharacterized protein n=1 Tax=Equus asinus asinus TaxID=83772 RepID=A0A8C4LCT1_EQUAS
MGEGRQVGQGTSFIGKRFQTRQDAPVLASKDSVTRIVNDGVVWLTSFFPRSKDILALEDFLLLKLSVVLEER